MASADHIILCGGAPAPRRVNPDEIVRLELSGDERNVDLQIDNISRRLSSAVPDILWDLIEIASYVYCADQAVTRGGEGVLAFGAQWRRNFIFHIPVRMPSVWSSPKVLDTLRKTLGILSEDIYEFHFVLRTNPVPVQQYLTLNDGDSPERELDEVLLFSGGLDSLGGTVHEAVVNKRRVALVSHRSNSKVFSRQKNLIAGLHAICNDNPPLHVPVWVHQRGIEGREYTQRSRTFLYASLGAAVARVFGLKRVRFYENGVVSLNLPISEQVVGARATRTTHPQVLDGFASLFSLLVQETFTVENPFLWITKTEVVNLIGDAGCGHLIGHSVSCTHTHEQTKDKPHCGRCSQCVSRRFATLASRFGDRDPGGQYASDLLTGARSPEKDRTLVESFIRTATEIGSMNELQVIEHYGEVSRVLRHLRPLSADQVAEKVIQLYRRHSSEVSGVMDGAIRDHASDIREGKLPATCAILLAIPESYKKTAAAGGTPTTLGRQIHSTCDSDEPALTDQTGPTAKTLTPAERMRELAAHPFVRDTETRASLEFHRCAHENQAKWWVVEKQAYLIYPRNPSEEELLEALKNPADVVDATLGEMAAANYAATIIEAIVIGAMASIQGPELETFIQECIRAYTEKACKLLRPASENEESRNRVGHFIDLAVTTALTSMRMVSHVQAGIKNGMEWEDLARLVPRRSALPDDDGIGIPTTDANRAGTETGILETPPETVAPSMARVDLVAQERCAALLEFKTKGKRLGIKITDLMVAQAANPKWHDRSMVQWWKRNYEKGCKPPQDRMIRAVLARDPGTIWQPGNTKPNK